MHWVIPVQDYEQSNKPVPVLVDANRPLPNAEFDGNEVESIQEINAVVVLKAELKEVKQGLEFVKSEVNQLVVEGGEKPKNEALHKMRSMENKEPESLKEELHEVRWFRKRKRNNYFCEKRPERFRKIRMPKEKRGKRCLQTSRLSRKPFEGRSKSKREMRKL